METKHILFCFLALSLLFSGCRGDEQQLEPWVSEALSEYNVIPIYGGAIVSYTIPKDPDILYIMAEYKRNGIIFTEKASVHNNELRIEGFNTTDPVEVTLYKVNHHEQKSDPLIIRFTPLESLVSQAISSMNIKAAFGGVILSWDNLSGTELGIHLYKQVEGEMVLQDIYYTSQKSDSHAFRGFDVEESLFGVTVEDKWGNMSEMITATLTPNFEALIEKPYADYRDHIPFDNTTNYNPSSYPFANLWDNIVATRQNGWLTRSGGSGCSITIDLKQVVKLSRIVQHFYQGATFAPYGQANINEFEAWGIAEIPDETVGNREYWLDEWSVRNGHILDIPVDYELPERTFKDDWHYLGTCETPIYDAQADINSMCTYGASYDLSEAAGPVRFVRLIVKRVAGQPTPLSNYFSCGELTFYGDNTVSNY